MATAAETEHPKEIRGDFLCCTRCLGQFRTPKILPCLHTFCEQCLTSLLEKTGYLKCPECRQQCQVPNEGVSGVKDNLFMVSLIELFTEQLKSKCEIWEDCERCGQNMATHKCMECQLNLCVKRCVIVHQNLPDTKEHRLVALEGLEKIDSVSLVGTTPAEYCSVHTSSEINFYCETCQVPICTDCKEAEHGLPEHVNRDLQEKADEYLKDMKIMVDRLKVKQQEAETCETRAKQTHSDLEEHHRQEEKKVRMKAEEIIKQIKQEEQRLIENLNKHYEGHLKRSAADINELEFKHSDIKGTCSYMETLMHHGNAAQLLSTKGEAQQSFMRLIATETKPGTEYGWVEFKPSKFNEVGVLGEITRPDTSGSAVTPMTPLSGKFDFPSVEHSKSRYYDNRVMEHDDDAGARHEVAMTMGDQQTPQPPVVRKLVKTIGNKGSSEGQFIRPVSVAINKQRDIVTADSNNNRLQVTTLDGRVKKILRFTKFHKPFIPIDIVVSGDMYYSLDDGNKQVVVSNKKGSVIRKFGHNELKDPYGIAISPVNGNVYVTDKGDHCIRIYKQGQYLRSLGSEGKGHAQFNWPRGITVAGNGVVFVADYRNNRIQVFTADDEFLYLFPYRSNGDGTQRNPLAITTDNRYLYVSDNHSIHKLDLSGRIICRIDSDEDRVNSPTGLALTDEEPSRVVVADMGNHCIKIFAQ